MMMLTMTLERLLLVVSLLLFETKPMAARQRYQSMTAPEESSRTRQAMDDLVMSSTAAKQRLLAFCGQAIGTTIDGSES